MVLNKNDKEKIDNYLDATCKYLVWCFNSEYTPAFLTRKINDSFEQATFHNDIGKLRLQILDPNQEIVDVSEGYPDSEVEKKIKDYYTSTLKKKLKEKLPIHFEELTKAKKAEKDKENEAKGKKTKK